MSVLRTITRTFAVAGKETLVVLRRPSALATLVLGPVVILAISFAMLLGIGALRRWTTRHDRV